MTGGGNVYDKYASRNPIERRFVDGFLEQVGELADRSNATEAHEVGCGEGEISTLLARRGLRVRGSDVSAEVIEEARRRSQAAGVTVHYRAAAISDLRADHDAAELIVCCEVLEHLDDPDTGLETLAGLARPWLLVSVPREPIWRALNLARGKYVRDLGNTPGHLGHWSRRGFIALLRSRVDVVDVRSPLPWTMALCRANGR
jgi:2-polyprenyl-3-methyl-5-hydroxy-6-metoxy-1,4-benzoquinol methylase